MRILAFDIGEKRIGVAISDELGITAQGLETIERKDSLDKIKGLVSEREVGEIVVGLPLNMNGSKGPRANDALNFAEELRKELGIEVKLWDERMSTLEVERLMIQGDVSRKKRKKKIDKLAAQVILQSYLTAKKG